MGPIEMHVKLRWPQGESKFTTGALIAFANRCAPSAGLDCARAAPQIKTGNNRTARKRLLIFMACTNYFFCQKLARAEKSTSSFAAPLTALKTSRVAAAEGSGTPN